MGWDRTGVWDVVEQVADNREQAMHSDGFGEEIAEANLQGTFPVHPGTVARAEHDGDGGAQPEDLASELHPVASGHGKISEDEIHDMSRVLKEFQCLGWTAGGEDFVAVELEDFGGDPEESGFIIDEQDGAAGFVKGRN